MDSMDKYLGTTLDERYELMEKIGAGGMAVVYKALDHRLGRNVAVKILRDELADDRDFRTRFQTEAQAVAMLSHPNIVSVYDVSRKGAVEYIVMELIEGITLKQYMLKKGALGWKEALHFSVQITKALEHAHEKGIIHRDIKPQNIMIIKDGTIKVADFGIAALENSQEKSSETTLGSVHYMSPEQAKGEVPDARCDIYSLGVVMYEMLTGALPYIGSTAEEIALKHISGSPIGLSEHKGGIPQELERITLRAMCSDKSARYQSASELREDLERFQKQQAAASAAVSAGGPAGDGAQGAKDVRPLRATGEMTEEQYQRRKLRSRKVSILTGVFGVLVFMIGIFIFLWNFWLKDLFRVAERVDMPNFVGEQYDEIINSKEFSIFNFKIIYDINQDVPEGQIIDQSPESGRSMMIVSEGIDVKLTVSTGVMLTDIPDVVNWQYQEATLELQRAGFVVEQVFEQSATVTADYVIKTSPEAGEQLSAGSTVFITISSGPEVKTVSMPNLIGLDEAGAKAKIESYNLTCASVTRVASDYEKGVVFKQSIQAYTEVEEHTKIYIWVSDGPEAADSGDGTVG